MSDFSQIAETTLLPYEKSDLDRRGELNKTFFVNKCNMGFVDDHYGLRPGCLHTLLGSTGRGKSTLTQSLILEWGKKEKILLYLTEESVDRIELKFFEKDPEASYLSSKLHITHERDLLKEIDSKDYRAFCLALEEKLKKSKAKILIIDNLTTSQFYESKFHNVTGLLSKLRDIADNYQIPIFLICHTKKGVNETTKGLMLPDDVRGSASLAMTSDYFYTFYRLRITSEFGITKECTFVYVNKCRDHNTQDYIYRLDYDVNRKRYTKDSLVNFKVFKDAIKERDRA